MKGRSISSQWTCKCNAVNPLRKKYCVSCGSEMPLSFRNKVFREEIYIQNQYFRKQREEKESILCEKIDKNSAEMSVYVLAFWIVVFIVLNGTRLFLYTDTITANYKQFSTNRIERYQDEKLAYEQSFTGAKQISGIVTDILNTKKESVKDVSGESDTEIENDGIVFDPQKINLIKGRVVEVKNKVMEVINFVTRQFK